MERHPNDLTTDEEIDAALERAKAFDSFPRIVEATYRPEPGLEFLMLRLSDGQRLLIPKEKLDELEKATPEQAMDLEIGPHGRNIWWKQLDDGLYLPDFLEYRWEKSFKRLQRSGRSQSVGRAGRSYMKKVLLVVTCIVVAGFGQAQAPVAVPVAIPGPAGEVLTAYNRVKPNLLKAAEKMPEADFQFKPTADIRTYARIVNHVTEAQFHTCTTLNGTKFDPKSVPGDFVDKATIVAGLKASFAECDKAYGALTDANILEVVSNGTAKRSRIGFAWGNVSHDNEQYAELSTYLRLKGIAPPTSEK